MAIRRRRQENTKYSALADINADNVQRLHVVWQWQHGESRRDDYQTVPGNFETTPLMIDGVLYVTTPYNNIAAISADTGKELWRFDGEAYKLGPIPGTGFKHRGAAVWRDGANLRVFSTAGRACSASMRRPASPSSRLGRAGRCRWSPDFRNDSPTSVR